MKIILKFILYFSVVVMSVGARTLTKDNNNQPNEIPREPLKISQPQQNSLLRQNPPNPNLPNPNDPQVTMTAANIQNLLSTSPIVQAFLSNTTVQTVLSDPIVQGVLRNPTVQSVLGNQIMQNILFDPALQGLAMQTFLSSFTTTPPPIPQLPPTTPISPFFQLINTPPTRTSFFTSTQPSVPPRPNTRPIAQPNRPSTQQTLLTALILGIDEVLNILQAQLATRNRNRFNGNGQRN